MKYKGYALVWTEVDAENDEQAKEKIADKLGDDYFSWFDPDEIVLTRTESEEHTEKEVVRIAKVIGRLIAVLVDAGIVEREQAVWILEPLKEKAESEDT